MGRPGIKGEQKLCPVQALLSVHHLIPLFNRALRVYFNVCISGIS